MLAEESQMQSKPKVKLVMIDRRGDFPLQDGLGRAVTLQGGISPGPGCFVRQRRVIIEGSAGELMLVLGRTRGARCWQ